MNSTRLPGQLAILRVVDGPWRAGDLPDPTGFADAVDIALAIERRATNGAIVSDDLRRYHLASAAISRHARATGVTVASVDPEVLVHVTEGGGTAGRLARTFHPPWTLDDHLATLHALEGTRADVARALIDAATTARRQNAGYVVTIDGGHLTHRTRQPSRAPDIPSRPQSAAATALEGHDSSIFENDTRRSQSLMALRTEAAHALRHGLPLSIGSGARHEVLAELLRELTADDIPTGELRILYVDGSEPPQFPIGTVVPSGRTGGTTLRFGLMSMRHTELDIEVHGYWFRNRLVSLPRSLAETETDCATQSTATLETLTNHGVDRFEIVHTGFEPAVVGFYRAVAGWLRDRARPPIEVQPLYLAGRSLHAGTLWKRQP